MLTLINGGGTCPHCGAHIQATSTGFSRGSFYAACACGYRVESVLGSVTEYPPEQVEPEWMQHARERLAEERGRRATEAARMAAERELADTEAGYHKLALEEAKAEIERLNKLLGFSAHRPSWDDTFMAVARAMARRATCDRLHVGAVLVQGNRLVSTGYNGAPPGQPHCDEVGHLLVDVAGRPSCKRTIHAELNAVLYAAPADRQGATLYVTAHPCDTCATILAGSGIKRVVWADKYSGKGQAANTLRAAGITLQQHT